MDMEEMESMIEREAALSAMISEVEEVSDFMKSVSAPLETRMAVYGALSAVKLYYRHGGEDCALLARKALGRAFEAVSPVGPMHGALKDMERLVDVIGGWER